jgi:hypothetical protein
MRNRGRFKFGWDAEKRRGIMTSRYLHITRPGKEKEALDRAARAIELQFDYYGPFGFGAVVARLDEPMFDLNKKVAAQMLRDREIAIHGSKQYVIDTIMRCATNAFTTISASSAGSSSAASTPRRSRADADLRRGGDANPRARMRRQGRTAGTRPRSGRLSAPGVGRGADDGKQAD